MEQGNEEKVVRISVYRGIKDQYDDLMIRAKLPRKEGKNEKTIKAIISKEISMMDFNELPTIKVVSVPPGEYSLSFQSRKLSGKDAEFLVGKIGKVTFGATRVAWLKEKNATLRE